MCLPIFELNGSFKIAPVSISFRARVKAFATMGSIEERGILIRTSLYTTVLRLP